MLHITFKCADAELDEFEDEDTVKTVYIETYNPPKYDY